MKSSNTSVARRGKLALIAGAVIVVLLVIGLLTQRSGTVEGSVKRAEAFTVREGPLTISITEAGTIQAKDQIVLKNEVEGQAQIIYLIDEGTEVKKGDLLVELDASQLVDSRVDQEIQVQNKEAQYISARENLGVVKNQAESDISAAELAYQFAQEDLTKYVDGDYPMAVKEAEAKIALSISEQRQTKEQLQGSKRLFDEGFLTSIEYDQHQAQAERAELDLKLAESAMELLKKYTYVRQMTELKSAIEEAERALERARLKANADVVQAEANLRASESEFERQKDKLAKLDEQIEKTKIFAPAAGLAIHATTATGGWRSRNEPLDEGQTVRERQELIYLPTANQMTAEVRVHESNLNKIRPGLGVRVTVDALPELSFSGHITKIAPLPDAQSAYMNPDLKVYTTEIDIEGANPALRTGMTCEAEIMVARFENATYVPVQSVFMVQGSPTAFVTKGSDGFEQRPVEIGLDNNRMLQIASGLTAGEEVLMTPPLDVASLTAGDGAESVNADFIESKEIVAPAVTPPERSGGRGEQADRAEGGRREGGRRGGADGGEGGGRRGGADGGEGGGRRGGGDGGEGGGRRGGGEGGAAAAGGPGGGANLSDEERAAMRERFQNMSEEERAKMREERMKNMTPEERAAWEQRRQGGGNRERQPQ